MCNRAFYGFYKSSNAIAALIQSAPIPALGNWFGKYPIPSSACLLYMIYIFFTGASSDLMSLGLQHHHHPHDSHNNEHNYPNAIRLIKAEEMKPPRYGKVVDIYAQPLVKNAPGGQSAKVTYNIPKPLESNGSPSLPPWLSYIEESHESESYGIPQAEVLTYPPEEFKYIPKQSLDSFETFVSFPQVLDDEEPNIPQVPSSDTPDQENPEQYLNNNSGAVINVHNNPLDYSKAVTNFLKKMRDERVMVLDLTNRG